MKWTIQWWLNCDDNKLADHHHRGGDPAYTPRDQTGAEVRTQAWYLHSSGWDFAARFKSRAKAAANWDASKVTQDCNCDCTGFVSACAEAGGVNIDGAYTGGNAAAPHFIR